MNELGPDFFETELRKLRPARPPQQLLDRLDDLIQPRSSSTPKPRLFSTFRAVLFQGLWRWLLPAAGAAVLLAILITLRHSIAPVTNVQQSLVSKPSLKADQVEINRQLVATFDAVSRLPTGEPVRFRCSQWLDDVVLRDSVRGVSIEQRSPRLEVVPVSFEIY
jgi:hypothetical protein